MKRKLLSGLLICVLALGAVLGLTACKMSQDKYVEAVNEMAKTYYASHKDSSNFGDITLNYTVTQKVTEINSLFEDKTDSQDVTLTVKVATKKVGEIQTLQVEYTVTEKTTYYISENDAPVVKENATTEAYKYVYGYMTVEGENQFYALKEKTVTENGQEPEITKLVEQLDEEEYLGRMDTALSNINSRVSKTFTTAEDSYQYEMALYGAKISIEKDKDVITYNDEYTLDQYGGNMSKTTVKDTITFVNGAPEKIVMALDSVGSDGSSFDADGELTITYSADYALASDVNAFAEYGYGSNLYASIPSFSFSF